MTICKGAWITHGVISPLSRPHLVTAGQALKGNNQSTTTKHIGSTQKNNLVMVECLGWCQPVDQPVVRSWSIQAATSSGPAAMEFSSTLASSFSFTLAPAPVCNVEPAFFAADLFLQIYFWGRLIDITQAVRFLATFQNKNGTILLGKTIRWTMFWITFIPAKKKQLVQSLQPKQQEATTHGAALHLDLASRQKSQSWTSSQDGWVTAVLLVGISRSYWIKGPDNPTCEVLCRSA